MLALLFLPLLGAGQAIDLITYQNTAIQYDFTSRPNSPSIPGNSQPTNGTVAWVTTSSFHYRLTYTPNQDFTGTDHFRIVRWEVTPVPHVTYLDVSVIIAPALIRAYHDYAVTHINEPVVVDVLANDISSNGIKVLQAVPAINHGTASFNPTTGLIAFTPNPGFKGLAHFNYALCNGAGDCDDGTVSITVMDTAPATADEVIQVFTKKNEAQFILVPADFILTQGPANGIFDAGADIPDYTPANNYVGPDTIRFTDGNHAIFYVIEVLNLASNVFAFDDRAFTTTNSEVTIPVKTNDFSVGTCGFSVYSQASHGTASITGNQIIYTPDPGFVGVDQFTYRSFASGCAGTAEIATVTVFVSNFAPDRTTFEMATPKGTPIIIGYNVPVSTFTFHVSSQGQLGQTLFLPGAVDTLINGVPVQGNNILIYIPNDGVQEGLDQIEITYCLRDITPGSEDCLVSKQVKIWMTILDIGTGDEPVCVGDCVWAGDTNADGIVNMTDLLPIGRSRGEIGTERIGATFEVWYGQYAEDWSDLFASGEYTANVKHIDADGNSIVTAADTVAIRSFYGRTHNMVPAVMPYAPYEFILEGPLFINPGDYVEFSIKVGTPAQPAEDIYGFVFPFNYNPDAIAAESVQVNWRNDNFLAYDSPVLFMDHNNLNGLFEAGYTRTSGLVASGHGELGTLGVIVDDIIGFRSDEEEMLLQFGGDAGVSMDKNGQYSAVRVRPFQLRVKLASEEAETSAWNDDQLKTFPNPSGDYVTVHLNGQQEFEQLTLSTLMGQVVQHQSGLRTNQTTLDVSQLPTGIYILSVAGEKGMLNRKIEVMR